MKQFIVFSLLALCLHTVASAQLVAKLNPGGLLPGLGSASLEGFVTNRVSGQIDGYLLPGVKINGTEFSGGGAGISGRFYATTATRPNGLFVSPFVAEHWISFRDIRAIAHQYNYTALGGQLGYQKTLGKIVTVELGAGLWTGLNVPTIKQAYGVNSLYGEGIHFWLNAGLGLVIWAK